MFALGRGARFALALVVLAAGGLALRHEAQQQQQQQQQQEQQQSQDNNNRTIWLYLNKTPGLPNSHGGEPKLVVQQQQQQQHQNQKQQVPRETLSSAMLKTFIRTNGMRAYHLDLHSYRPEATYEGDASFVDSRLAEHKARCSQHLSRYLALVDQYRSASPVHESVPLDALRLADTLGRPGSGLLKGNQFWLGEYESCREFKHNQGDASDHMGGQYCLGISQFPNWNPADGKTSVKVGVCVPETCSNSMLNQDRKLLAKAEQLMKLHFDRDGPFGQLKLRSLYCLPHPTSQARQLTSSASWLLAVLGLFVLTCTISTALDWLKVEFAGTADTGEPRWPSVVVDSFSLIRNLRRFVELREPSTKAASKLDHKANDSAEQNWPAKGGSPSSLATTTTTSDDEGAFDRSTFFNITTGLKCIGLIWIIAAHTFMVAPILTRNGIDNDKLTKTFLADIYVTAHLMVDTFFALSGILASYLIFREGIATIRPRDWLVLTVHRYWRLTPIYLLCYWFTKSLGHLFGSGPLWDYMTASQSPRLACSQESWLSAILYLSDFKSPKEHCVPFAWFIANGIKFWMLTPLFLLAIHKSFKRGYALALGTCAASALLVTVLGLRTNVDIKAVIEFKPEAADNMLNNMEQIYTRPYSRIGAYLIGLLAGHLIFMSERGQLKFRPSKATSGLIWSLVGATVLLLTFILKIANSFKLNDTALAYTFAISSALIRPIWAACSCWLVVALAHGQARWLARFLSLNCWQLMVKLSFCAYLVQGEVIANLYLTTTHSESFTYLEMISRPLTAVLVTILVSFLMVMFLEFPLLGVERLLITSKRARRSKTSSGQQQQQQETQTKLDTNKQISDRTTINGKAPSETSCDMMASRAAKLKCA